MANESTALKALKFLYKFKASLFLFFLILVFYFSISGGKSFIPVSEILSDSFGVYAPENSLLFIFVHESLNHLFENLFALLAYAIIVELVLGSLDVLLIFFISAIAGAIVYLFFNANALLLGASTGVMGLASTALFLNLKKALMLSIAMLIAVYFIITPGISMGINSQKQLLDSQKDVFSTELETAKIQGDVQKQQVLARQISEVQVKSMQLVEGQKFADSTPTSNSAHAFGAFFGLAYLFIFRHNKFKAAARDLHGIFRGVLGFVGLRSKVR